MDPGGQGILGQRSVGSADHDSGRFRLGGVEVKAVDSEKRVERDKGGSLVSVHKGVVLGDAKGVGGGKDRQVRPGGVVPLLLRSSERRLKKSLVANAEATSVF